jgi:hypothetical protein
MFIVFSRSSMSEISGSSMVLIAFVSVDFRLTRRISMAIYIAAATLGMAWD